MLNSDLTRVENTIVRERLLVLLSGFFTVVAGVLAATGLYGVLSYSISRCTKDIRILLTLEAPHDSVLWLSIRQITPVVDVGLAAGLAGELSLCPSGRRAPLSGKAVRFLEPSVALASLLAVATLAALGPAIQPSCIDP
jgi:hypothetical protein